ncbi:MAG: hypothetical protein K1X57_07165 [Gemmataceae bacterium]|nr:hypothetical protein [Gemmataceae bacterium]
MNPFGPLFLFELTRIVRRQRMTAGRCGYVLVLLVMLGFVYLSLFPHGPESVSDFLFMSSVNPKDIATFGSVFFSVFAILQFIVGTFAAATATPAILAEEKERATLPFLLTTVLRDREIVLGKLAARVAQVFMVLLAGLPVLAIMQVMGGVDPILVICAFAATAASVLSAAGIGAAISIAAPNVKIATGRTVGIIAAYAFVLPFVTAMLQPRYGMVILGWWGSSVVSFGQVLDWCNSGNLFWGMSTLFSRLARNTPIDDILYPLLGRFVGFHVIVAVVTGTWAATRLRRTLSRQADRAAAKATRSFGAVLGRGRAAVSQRFPVYWRETKTAVGRPTPRLLGKCIKWLAYLASFAPLAIAIYEGITRGRLAREVHEIVRGFGSIGVAASLLHIANSAASMISRERRQKTFDELCLTDLSNREILFQKSLGAIWSARWFLVWTMVHWAVGILVGAISPLAIVLVVPVYWIYTITVVRIGMFFSIVETPKLKAQQATTLLLVLMAALPWLLPIFVAVVLNVRGRGVESVAMFTAGLSAPVALGFLTVSNIRSANPWGSQTELLVIFAIGTAVGIAFYVLLGEAMRMKTNMRFAWMRRESHQPQAQSRE